MSQTIYHSWVSRVQELARVVRELELATASMGLPPANSMAWHGNLFQKLLPQLSQDPYLIVAVAGGTNIGKSVIFNHLAGSRLSRTHANATQTKHPLCSVPRGFLEKHDLTQVFPDFEIRHWKSEDDPLADGPDNLLFVREDNSGQQPQRLLLLDTPDVDGVLRHNWRRAELIRHASDVLVAVLTQQKYNDAAVREFFQPAAAVDKTVLVVFNMVQWPRQKEHCEGWLKTFCEGTGITPAHVYAAPMDFDAAEANRLPFFAMSPESTDPRADLAELQFDSIKIRSLSGSLRGVLSPADGLPAYLQAIQNKSQEYRAAQDILSRDLRRKITDLPQIPRRLMWDEIWKWLETRRGRFDRAVNGFYSAVAGMFRWKKEDPAEELERFKQQEYDKLRTHLADFLDQLDTIRRGGNSILSDALGRVLGGLDRAKLFAELERRHAEMPLLTDSFRDFLRQELDEFERENPRLVKLITHTLVATAVVRPVITIGCGVAGAGFAEVLTHQAISVVGDIVIGAATTVGAEGLLSSGVSSAAAASVSRVLGRIYSKFYLERETLLATTLHELVLRDELERISQQAELPATPTFQQAVKTMEILEQESQGDTTKEHRTT
ncbi:MAG: GTPase [Planctomycetota bacterium]|nr:GTPase [Planctomycetota bacterium]